MESGVRLLPHVSSCTQCLLGLPVCQYVTRLCAVSAACTLHAGARKCLSVSRSCCMLALYTVANKYNAALS
jgi:hypothetical protein